MNEAARKAALPPLGEKRITRASSKFADGSRPVVTTTRTQLSDRLNLKDGQVLRTKLEAKAIAKKGDTKAPASKQNEKESDAKQVALKPCFDEVVLNCAEYGADMIDYIFWLQKRFPMSEDFLATREVTPKMRSILVDWLVEVHVRFHLLPETFFGTINIVDRYLACGPADKTNLQLIGVTSMCISAKYEEIYPPDLQDYEFIAENTFSRKDIIRMELKILSALKCDLGRPSVILFIRRLSTYFNPHVHSAAKYLGENAVCDYATCHLSPSTIAAVSVWIGALLKKAPFPAAAYEVARVTREEVHEWAPVFARGFLKIHTNKKLSALRTKYSHPKNGRVSEMTSEQIAILEQLGKADSQYFINMP